MPRDPVPSDPVPSDPVPSDPVPSDPVPSDPVPSDPVPSDPVPSDPVPSALSDPVRTRQLLNGHYLTATWWIRLVRGIAAARGAHRKASRAFAGVTARGR